MTVRTLDTLELKGKRVLIRADLNVPIKDGKVSDATRIEACAPTIREVIDNDGIAIVISHLGRPKGKPDPALSLRPVVAPLKDALGGREVIFLEDCVGPATKSVIGGLGAGQTALLENLRFHPGETANDPDFAAALAELADVYIDDAFSAAHRAHASIVGVAERLPAAAGRLMQRELETLANYLGEPAQPYLAILGGAKIETKLGVAETLAKAGADIVLAGGMANTALFAQGRNIGASLYDADLADTAKSLFATVADNGRDLILPVDAVVAPGPDAGGDARTVAIDEVPSDAMILDVGPRTTEKIVDRVNGARTLVWNGPLGVCEQDAFAKATLAVAGAVAERTDSRALTSVVGGGDTVAALHRAGLLDRFSYASMAGGAFLAWLEGAALPGVAVLQERK